MKKSNDYIGAWRLPEVTIDTSVDKGHGLMRSRGRIKKQCPKRRSRAGQGIEENLSSLLDRLNAEARHYYEASAVERLLKTERGMVNG